MLFLLIERLPSTLEISTSDRRPEYPARGNRRTAIAVAHPADRNEIYCARAPLKVGRKLGIDRTDGDAV